MNSDTTNDFSVPVDQQELKLSVYKLKEDLVKLCNLTGKLDMTAKQQTEPCDIVDLAWLFEEKCKMINNINQDLIESGINLPTSEGERLIELYDTLVKENKQHEQILNYMSKTVHSSEETSSEFNELIRKIESNEEGLETGTMNTPDMLDVELLFKNSAKKMSKMRENLQTLLDVCFEDTNTKDLIKDLTNAYFKGGDDKYINLSETTQYAACDLYMLTKAALIVEDPYDHMRIKISDIV